MNVTQPATREMAESVLTMGQCQHILDVGASPLTVLLRYAIAPHAEVILAQLVEPPSWARPESVRWVTCDIRAPDLPRRDGYFDLVVLGEVLEHLPVFPAAPLTGLWRALRPGGYVLVTTPNVASLHKRIRLLFGQCPVRHLETASNRWESYYREYTMRGRVGLLREAGSEIECAKYSRAFDTVAARWNDAKPFCNNALRAIVSRFVLAYCTLAWLVPQWRANMHILVRRPNTAER